MRFFILIAAAMVQSPLTILNNADRYTFFVLLVIAAGMDITEFVRGLRRPICAVRK